MSRRNKSGNTADKLILHGVSKIEYRLKNYLHLNNIKRGEDGMQTIIINSFWVNSGGDNDAEWRDKLEFANKHFGKFAMYSQNNWK